MSSVLNRLFLLLAAGYLVLCLYLFRDVQVTGDGAAYSLQAIEGNPWLRSIHAGALAPLWAWVHWTGLPAGIAGVLWTGLGLVASYLLGLRLLEAIPRDPRLPPSAIRPSSLALLGPLSLLAATATWNNALFVEIYAPLAALTLAGLVAVLSQHRWVASTCFLWAGLVHPGAWALVPGLLLFAEERTLRRWVAPLIGTILLYSLALLALYPDWWDGGRGLADLPPSDQGLWPALQSLWRLLADDLGPASLPALLALPLLSRRRLMGFALVVLASAGLLCRYSDNPGGLPALWILLSCAPLIGRALDSLDSARLRSAWSLLIVLLLVFGIGDATSEHDAQARAAEVRDKAWLSKGCEHPRAPDASWAERQLHSLACRPDS